MIPRNTLAAATIFGALGFFAAVHSTHPESAYAALSSALVLAPLISK